VSSPDIEPGSKILCQELNTGKAYTVFFYLDDKTISTEICSYDESFHLVPEKPIFLRTENNQIVSLHSNISDYPGSSVRMIEPKMETHKQHVISNTAVIGHDRWEEADKLKRVTFLVRRAKDLLKHKEKFDKLAKRKIGDEYDSDLFSVDAKGITVRAGYSSGYSLEYKSTTNITPYFEIEFHEGVTLSEYLDYVNCLVEFLSFSLGSHMNPSDIRISRLSSDELTAAIKAHAHPEDYAVAYVWREVPVESLDLWIGGSLFKAWDDEEIAALQDCVGVWMARDAEWNRANIQMMRSLCSKNEISADRLLTACKWFEEIPLTRAQAAITDEHIEFIAEAAAQKGSELGYRTIKNRITGALKSIKTESNEDKFSRLLNAVKQKFGPSIVDDWIITHLKRALDFRGKSAHGHFSPADESEFRVFVKSVCAMEALCFLLTACDLPITVAGVERAHSHPFIRDCRRAYEA
jgi:ApeA N-terminal domain 1